MYSWEFAVYNKWKKLQYYAMSMYICTFRWVNYLLEVESRGNVWVGIVGVMVYHKRQYSLNKYNKSEEVLFNLLHTEI